MPKTARLLLAILLLTCFASAEEWNKSFPVTAKPSLTVTTNDAHVTVRAGIASQVQVRVTTIGYRIGDNGVLIRPRQDGNSVDLDVHVPNSSGLFGARDVSIEISVPEASDLDLQTHDGHIEVVRVRGDIHLRTGDGHITARGLDGKLRAHTGDGNVEVDGRFDLLDLQTSDGSIEAEAMKGSKLDSGWRLSTGDGNLILRLPDSVAADLEVHTGDGHIEIDLPVSNYALFNEHNKRCKLNGGGPLLIVHSGDGNISIERL